MSSLLTGGLAATIGSAFRSLFLDATLSRDVATPGPNAWTPGAAVPTAYPCKAIHEEWSASFLAGGLVNADDVKLIILATSLAVEPVPSDRVTIRGETFTIVPKGSGQPPVSTDPARATWTCRASR